MAQVPDIPPAGARAKRDRRADVVHVVKVVLALAALGLLVFTVVRQGRAVLDHARELTPLPFAGALGAVLIGLCCAALSWRMLLAGLGSPLPVRQALRVYFVGQLGKYLPGSVWPVLAQAELARELHVPRRRSAAAALLAVVVGLLTGVVAAALLLSLPGTGRFHRLVWLGLIPPAVLPLLLPRTLTWGLDLALRLIRRPDPVPLELDRASMLRASGWSLLMWAAFGVQVWLLAADLGAAHHQLLATATGVYAAAWVAGFVVLVAPAGVGIRETVLIGGLSAAMTQPAAVVVALSSRLLMTLGDVVLATAVVLWGKAHGRAAVKDVVAELPADERETDGSPA